jgi:hypothetical protein
MLPTPIQGVEFDAGVNGFDVLLGMDVITSGLLTVGGNGNFQLGVVKILPGIKEKKCAAS